MFQLSDKFYQDLGLIKMPSLFWEKSMIEKPANKNVVCHGNKQIKFIFIINQLIIVYYL